MFSQSAPLSADAEPGDHEGLAEGGHCLARLPGSGAQTPTQDVRGAADALAQAHGEPGHGGEHGVPGPGARADAGLHDGADPDLGAAPRPHRQVQSQRDKNILQCDAGFVDSQCCILHPVSAHECRDIKIDKPFCD